MHKKNRSIGNKGNNLENNCRTRFSTTGFEWYNIDHRKPMMGYSLDEDGNYPENWRWF